MRELIKLSQLPKCGGYTTLLYTTDKTSDETINELSKLIKLKVRQVSYSDIIPVLKDLIDAKNACADALDKMLWMIWMKRHKKICFKHSIFMIGLLKYPTRLFCWMMR
jgi:hypothetical protein